MRLLGVELRRAFARRLTKAVFVLCLAGVIAAGLATYFTSKRETVHITPDSGAVSRFVEACTNGDQDVGPLPPLPSPGTTERRDACQALVSQKGGETIDKRFHLVDLMDIIKHVSAMAAIVAWLLGASFIGAEWRSGSLATLLTWEPRRLRVMVAKAAAAVIASFIIVMVLEALLVGALFPAAVYHGSTAGTGGHFWRSFIYIGFRSGGLAAAAAVAGFSVGAIGRNTAASLGAGFFYLAIVEAAIVGNFIKATRPWLLVRNAVVFVNNERLSEIANRTPLQAGLIVFGYAFGLFLIASAVTRARDVN